jgi:predicted Zn-dependent peptidase
LNKSLKLVDKCIEQLKKGEWDTRLYTAARNRLLPGYLRDFEEPWWIAEELTQRDVFGRDPFDKYHRMIAVTKDDVLRVAKQYLGDNRLEVIINPA